MNIEQYPPLLTTTEVAEYLRVSKMTLTRWNNDGTLIEGRDFIRVGGRGDKRYKKEAILKFLNEKKIV